MDPVLIGTLLVSMMLILLLSGISIAIALGTTGLVGILAMRPWGAAEYLIANFPYSFTAHFSFTVLPLFLFMGYMAFSANLSQRAFEAGQRWLGHIPGGLAMATIFGCAAFSAVCGSSVATASTMARVALPEMIKRGYQYSLAGGSIAAGGTLGVLIPPSGILVIYSFITEVSLVKLFVAAIVPGIMTAIIYMIGIYIWVKMKPELAGMDRDRVQAAAWKERFVALGRSWEVMVLFAVVMGSIYLGIATATEAAALGAFLSLIMVAARKNAWRNIKEGLWETGTATSAIFLLIIGAGLFSLALNMSQLPTVVADYIVHMDLPTYAVFGLIILIYLVLGALVDGISMILITMPIVFPIILQLGYDPIWFGIIVVKAVELGCITPPVGINVFVVKGSVPQAPLGEIFKGCLPFVLMELLIIVLLITFPEIAMFLVGN
ncbi:MAG: TRAP transporter permease DctM [Sneathiella sp.]|jgi:tripartite ATP-independent transporter DctM subunit|uniref:TRAP transporter large permease n=1 Tax=Sneathiella sp. TaxID=1964365 RepID=UPI000C6577F9|nr:TRAP transporter large permease [Sneathiella sp.]MAL79132.1 TRAP transporter permease DctM [Sneathiella sp.]